MNERQGIYVNNDFIKDLKSSDRLFCFKIVKSVTTDYSTVPLDEDTLKKLIGFESVDNNQQYNSPWIFPTTHIDDDVITIRFYDDTISHCASILLLYDKIDSEDKLTCNNLAMVVPTIGAEQETGEFEEFKDYGENYLQFDFRQISGLRCHFDNCDLISSSFETNEQYPFKVEDKYRIVTPLNEHSHNLLHKEDKEHYYNMNNVVVELNKLYNNTIDQGKELYETVSNRKSMNVDTDGVIYDSNSEPQLAGVSGKEFIKTLGVADLFSDDSIHTSYGLVKVI
ncbi:MAG: hypothetical protein MJZ34_02970 [Paludibacteraceae bacterium]|nr:hypothetical protein [Paludibacteraceae bacterium]